MQTRFPPEPNGYLHIGHAKAICLDFGLAAEFGGKCNLRMDDTNPSKEETEYVDSIQEDVRWLGFDWGDRLFYASDYFDQLYEWAVQLIKAGKAYVCDLNAEQMREYRGTLTEPGKESPWRNRSVEENLDLFERMKQRRVPGRARTLRAKIDMASKNLNMRDPVMYRIAARHHHRTGDKWCIYPMYDYAHGQSDSIEGVTHSICTLEFENHRPLYNWFIEQLGIFPSAADRVRPAQPHLYDAEQAKAAHAGAGRSCEWMGRSAHADDFGDPAPRIHCPKRSGISARIVGVSKTNGITQLRLLEHIVREDLNKHARSRDGRVAAASRGDRQLSGRSGRRDGRGQQSRRSERGNAQGSVLESALHRAGRFP